MILMPKGTLVQTFVELPQSKLKELQWQDAQII